MKSVDDAGLHGALQFANNAADAVVGTLSHELTPTAREEVCKTVTAYFASLQPRVAALIQRRFDAAHPHRL
jgi:hypothetical protein